MIDTRHTKRIEQLNSHIENIKFTISNLQKEELKAYNDLSYVKKEIEEDNKNLIGKKAKCITEDGDDIIICTCNKIMVLDNFNIRPLFMFNNKKIKVVTYDWI
jgi:septation ring formation regulator EzrA